MARYRIILLPGDGIGPEVVDATVSVLETLAEVAEIEFSFESFPIGGAAIDACGVPLPAKTLAACRASDAVLLGAVGGPGFDGLEQEVRPEAGLLALRKELGVYANLRPVSLPASLAGESPLRESVVAGTDLLVVRELTGGIYFGTPSHRLEREAVSTMTYSVEEVERIARIAFVRAGQRRGKVTSVDKANVLEVSRLWRDVVSRVHRRDYSDVELEHMYVDNAAMQLIRSPRQFDVLLTGNLFGDILSDLAASLPGSLGLLPSSSVGGVVGLYEPVHGSAPDLAGKDLANPIAAILSAAMMLDDLAEEEAASHIRVAVEAVLARGIRTPDLHKNGTVGVGTDAMAAAISDELRRLTQLTSI
jgi:3-isopropylmalate dehydrogenase